MLYVACGPVWGRLAAFPGAKRVLLASMRAKVSQIEQMGGKIVSMHPEQGAVIIEGQAAKPLPFTQFAIQGKPFINDMPLRTSHVLGINPPMPQETVYNLFRPYGHLLNVSDDSVVFSSRKAALAALMCLHRSQIAGNELQLRLKPRPSWWRKFITWLVDHPRFALPLAFAASAAALFSVFEPIREAGVRAKLYLNSALASSDDDDEVEFSDALSDSDGDGIDDHIEQHALRLRQWVVEAPDTFIAVAGPVGSGKAQLVGVLGEPALTLDFKNFENLSLDECLKPLARAVGYYPLFQSGIAAVRALELALGGFAGLPPSLALNAKDQIEKVLLTVTHAVSKSAGRHAKPPLIVFNNYEVDNEFCELIISWLAELVDSKSARAVVVSSDGAYARGLQTALPSKALRALEIGDMHPEASLNYIKMHFSKQAKSPKAQKAFQTLEKDHGGLALIEHLGGRAADLETLGKRLVAGEDLETAVDGVIAEAAAMISQMLLAQAPPASSATASASTSAGGTSNTDSKRKNLNLTLSDWLPEQAWLVIKQLASGKTDILDLLVQPEFLSGVAPLLAMEKAQIIALSRRGGRVVAIKPARPVYQSACSKLIQDHELSGQMDLQTARARAGQTAAQITNCESELETLARAMKAGHSPETAARFKAVSAKLGVFDAELQTEQQKIGEILKSRKN